MSPMPRMRPDDAIGMEGLKRVGLFAGADELDGLPCDVADRQGRAAAGIAVHFRQDHSRESKSSMKFLRRVHGILAGHGVSHEQDLLRVEQLFQPLHFGHQLFVDVQAAGGVHDERVEAESCAPRAALPLPAVRQEPSRAPRPWRRPRRSWLRSIWPLLSTVRARRGDTRPPTPARAGARPFSASPASLPAVVVLPEPCRPAIRIHRGRLGRKLESRRVLAQ